MGGGARPGRTAPIPAPRAVGGARGPAARALQNRVMTCIPRPGKPSIDISAAGA